VLSARLPGLRSTPATLHLLLRADGLHGCGLAGLPGYTSVHLGLHCVSRRQSISWSSKRQNIVSRSSAEAEYRAMANDVAEACWLRQLLQELHAPLSKSTLIYCDNVSAVYLSTNPVQHQRTKHVEIDLHFAGNVLPSVMSASCMYRRPPSSRTFSRRVCPLHCF
jgi:hypothetical protein